MSESSNKYRPYLAATCNRVLALIKTMGKLANKLLDIPNVAEILPEDNARTRYCSIDETKCIIDAALRYECVYAGSCIALLFLLGGRAAEIRERTWDYFIAV
jgi:hypothetical protein